MARKTKPAKMKLRRKSGGGVPSVSESPKRDRGARKPKPTIAELTADLVFEGPGDLSTNPKYMEGFGQPNRPVQAAETRSDRKKGARNAEERLFLSLWRITLDNLPVGSFSHRRIAADEAQGTIAHAQKAGLLACCSDDDLLAPYSKDKRKDHQAMCKVLREHYGIAVTLRDFMTRPDENGSYTTFPLDFARVRGRSRLIVVTCMYMLPKRRKRASARPWFDMEIDPESVEFHLFESLDRTAKVETTATRPAGKKNLAQLFADSPLKGLELKCDRD
jgi:hypothetical protein